MKKEMEVGHGGLMFGDVPKDINSIMKNMNCICFCGVECANHRINPDSSHAEL